MFKIDKTEKKVILEMYGISTIDEQLLPTSPKESVPFKNTEEGNKFREWVNSRYPDIAKKINLDKNSPFYQNSYITKAWNEKIGNNTLGTIYKNSNSIYDKFNEYLDTGKEYIGKFLNPKQNDYDAILIGGLEHRPGDLNITQQVDKFKKGYGNKNIKGFSHNTPISDINNFLSKNPKIPIFMFSKGCVKSYELTTNKYVNKTKLFVIEPYGIDNGTKEIIKRAVDNGLPSKNVFVGPSYSRGKDIVSGTKSSEAPDHWSALNTVGQQKSNIT